MSETFCASLLVLLVALVGGLNTALLRQLGELRSEVRRGSREARDRETGR